MLKFRRSSVAVIFLAILVFADTAFALGDGEVRGTIKNIFVTQASGIVSVRLFETETGTIPAGSSCNTSDKYSFSMQDPGADASLSTLLFARATGAEVVLRRNGTCTIKSNSEDIYYLILLP